MPTEFEYQRYYHLGTMAALADDPRKHTLDGHAGTCWLAGYDLMMSAKRSVNTLRNDTVIAFRNATLMLEQDLLDGGTPTQSTLAVCERAERRMRVLLEEIQRLGKLKEEAKSP